MQHTSVKIKRCIEGEGCKSESEIADTLSHVDVELLFLNSNFDPFNERHPISYQIDDHLNQEIVAGFTKQFLVYISTSRAEMQDSILFSDIKRIHFYQNAQTAFNLNRYSGKVGELVVYEFKPSSENEVFQRYVFTFFDALSRLGGVYSALHIAGFMFTATFSYKLMMSSLVGKLFYFRPRFPEEVKKKKKKAKKGDKNLIFKPGEKTSKGQTKCSAGHDHSNKDCQDRPYHFELPKKDAANAVNCSDLVS